MSEKGRIYSLPSRVDTTEARELAVVGLQEVVQITRAALLTAIDDADDDLTAPEVIAATTRYQLACRDLAIYEAPRPQPVNQNLRRRALPSVGEVDLRGGSPSDLPRR